MKSSTKKSKFPSGRILSKIEMLEISGGWEGSVTLICKCKGNVGTWTGEYKSISQVSNAVMTYCDSEGAECAQRPPYRDDIPYTFSIP